MNNCIAAVTLDLKDPQIGKGRQPQLRISLVDANSDAQILDQLQQVQLTEVFGECQKTRWSKPAFLVGGDSTDERTDFHLRLIPIA